MTKNKIKDKKKKEFSSLELIGALMLMVGFVVIITKIGKGFFDSANFPLGVGVIMTGAFITRLGK